MSPIRLAIQQPITVAVGIVLTILAGYLALGLVPIEMTPEVQKGVIAVETIYPNANPADVESDVLREQEDVLRELGGLERMTGTATRGQASLRLELATGTDLDSALREVSQLLDEVPGYPPEVLQPSVEDTDPESNDYIAWFVVEGVVDGRRETGDGQNSDSASDRLPSPISPPPSDLDIQTLFDFVENRVAPRLERLPGMAQVNVLGGRERELQVRVDPERLAQRGMTMTELVNALQSGNRDFSAGALAQGNYDVTVRVPARWGSPREAMETVLRQDESGPVFLSDVATAVETYREESSFIRSRGRPVLAMNFQRELGSNVLEVMGALKAEVADINKPGGLFDQYAQQNGIGGTVRMSQVYDQTVYVEQAIGMVRTNLLLGAAIATFVLLLFLRSLRSVGIVALAIPVSVVGASVAMVALGRTINVVSLAGAAFAIGLVVDNSIVVLENIYRHLEMGKRPAEAAHDGTREVALAVLASTLTTVVVFIPVLLIEQQVGQLFRDLAIAICASVLISYAVSILVIPSAAALLLKQRGRRETGDGRRSEPEKAPASRSGRLRSTVSRLRRAVGVVPDFVANTVHRANGSWPLRGGVVAAALLLVAVGVWALLPPFDYLPKGNRNIVFGVILPPPGYNMDQKGRIADTVVGRMRPYFEAGEAVAEGGADMEEAEEDLPPVPAPDAEGGQITPPPLENYFIVGVGEQIFHGAISADDGRVVDLPPLFDAATYQAAPGSFAFAFQPPIFRLGGGSGAAVKIDVTGQDVAQVADAAGALFGGLIGEFGPQTPIQPSPASFNIRAPQISVVVDELRATDVGLDETDVGRVVQANGDGIILRDAYKFPDELRDVVVIAEDAVDQTDLDGLAEVPVATPLGRTVTLGEIADLQFTQAPAEIRRVGGERAVTLEVTAPPGMPLGTAVEKIENVIGGMRQAGAVPPTVNVDVAGTADALSEILDSLAVNAVVALLIVYLLMCVLFQSFAYPLVIMVTVPLATFGGFLGLWAVNLWSGADRYLPTTNLDVLAMLGFIILAGTVVNNAILIVEQTMNFLRMTPRELDAACVDCGGDKTEDGIGPRRAVTEATRSRVRPIFMSMLTSVGGMLPLVLVPGSGTELYRGLGAVVVGGLAVSTVFTLFVTPALLSLVLDLKQRLGLRLAGREEDVEEAQVVGEPQYVPARGSPEVAL